MHSVDLASPVAATRSGGAVAVAVANDDGTVGVEVLLLQHGGDDDDTRGAVELVEEAVDDAGT